MSEISTKPRTRHSIDGLLRGCSSDDQSASGRGENNSDSGRERRRQEVADPQTNIGCSVQGSVLSGQFEGPVAAGAGGEAVDLRGSIGAKYKPTIKREKQPVSRVPSHPVDFTGRGEELKEILKAFDRGATITGLRGVGGIGKTALALVLADRLKSRFRDGQIFIKLEGTSPNPLKPADAMAQVIRAFRGSDERLPDDQNELQGLYNSVLGEKRVLLLLDNAADDRQVLPLLPPRGCAVMVTSRKKFTLPGMPEPFLLDVMKPAEARELLLKICPRIGDWAGEMARLCGHLPMALRAAASLLAVNSDMSPTSYLEELRSEHTRLKRIGKEGLEEDRDVEAILDLSYSRLPSETASVFRLLSVFPTDFDAAAEEVICRDDCHRHLRELVRWSLVDYQPADGRGRYHLHGLVRIFAVYRLQAGEEAEAEERHSRRYQGVLWKANDLLLQGGNSMRMGLDLFDSERPNIQAGQIWAEKNMAKSYDIAEICSNFAWTGDILSLRLHPRENVRWLRAALVAARQIKNKVAEGAHLGNLGNAYASLGEPRKAIEYYEQALKISREIGDRRGEGADLGNLGSAYRNLGEPRKAIEHYEQALKISREIGDLRGEGNRLGNMGIAYADLGELRKAIEHYQQGLKISREIGDRRGEGAHLCNLGNAYFALGEEKKALDYYERRMEIARDIDDRYSEGNALWGQAICCEKMNDPVRAIKNAEEALKIFEQIESPSAATMRELLSDWRSR